MSAEEIRVGIGDYKASMAPSKIVTIGLGSCVGITLFDSVRKIGGLAHIMLPDSTQFSNVNKPGKFADLALPLIIEEMEALGANRRSLIVRISGGASMFNFADRSLIMDIGNRNVKAVKEALSKLSLIIRGEDTGGNQGRTMILETDTGRTYIKTVGVGIKEL